MKNPPLPLNRIRTRPLPHNLAQLSSMWTSAERRQIMIPSTTTPNTRILIRLTMTLPRPTRALHRTRRPLPHLWLHNRVRVPTSKTPLPARNARGRLARPPPTRRSAKWLLVPIPSPSMFLRPSHRSRPRMSLCHWYQTYVQPYLCLGALFANAGTENGQARPKSRRRRRALHCPRPRRLDRAM